MSKIKENGDAVLLDEDADDSTDNMQKSDSPEPENSVDVQDSLGQGLLRFILVY